MVTEVAGERDGDETIVGEGERDFVSVAGFVVVGEREVIGGFGPGGDVKGGTSVDVGEVDFRNVDKTEVNLEGDGIFVGFGGSSITLSNENLPSEMAT